MRNLKTRAQISSQDSALFTQDLCSRIEAARFDPRITESAVERLVLFTGKIDLEIFFKAMEQSPWPGCYQTLVDFARRLLPNSRTLGAILKTVKISPALSKAKESFSSFYIDLYNPSSARTRRALERNSQVWESAGFWAASPPYSKELLQFSGKDALVSQVLPLSGRSLENEITNFLHQANRWCTLSELADSIEAGLSKRQLLRRVKQIPKLQIQGTLKGTRYRLKPRAAKRVTHPFPA